MHPRILIGLLLLVSKTFGQNIDFGNVESIARNEMQSHERLMGREVQTGASNNFDVKHYRCEWQVDPAVRYISGKVTIDFKMVTTGSSIFLDLSNAGLITDSVKHSSLSVPFIHNHDILELDFANSILAGTTDSVSIYYHGIPASTGFGSFIQTTHAGIPIIWTLSEPYGSRDWWPCKNGLDDKPDSIDVYITAPTTYKAASNGLLQDEIAFGNNKITHWKHRYPIATYLICMAVTNYATFNNTVQLGTTVLPMVTFCYPENLSLFQANTPLVLNALQLYHNTLGDYPFLKEKYGHVQFGWGGGQEHQTSTFIVTPNEALMAHELAHQWFGDKITCASWADIWLNEGFATFVASYYAEQKYPSLTLQNRKNEINTITSQPGGSVWVDDTTNVNRIFDGRLSYYKGSHLLYMLRWKLGDSAFFKGLRSYLADPSISYGFANTNDLKRNLERTSGQDLTEFFKQWFYGQGYPSYLVNWSQVGSSFVKINIRQSTSHPSVNFFSMPVALQFKNATQQKTIVLNNTTNGQVLYEDIGFMADTLLIDPEYWLISKNNISHKVEDSIIGHNVVQIFPNPVHDQLSIYMRNFNSQVTSLTLYNSIGEASWRKNIYFNGSEFLHIPMGLLPAGTYFLSITNPEVHISKKIVKL